VWMWHGSCVLIQPACSRSTGGLAASAAVPGAVEQVTSLVLEEQLMPQCSVCIAASDTPSWSVIYTTLEMINELN